jgi:hypothetical protein
MDPTIWPFCFCPFNYVHWSGLLKLASRSTRISLHGVQDQANSKRETGFTDFGVQGGSPPGSCFVGINHRWSLCDCFAMPSVSSWQQSRSSSPSGPGTGNFREARSPASTTAVEPASGVLPQVYVKIEAFSAFFIRIHIQFLVLF